MPTVVNGLPAHVLLVAHQTAHLGDGRDAVGQRQRRDLGERRRARAGAQMGDVAEAERISQFRTAAWSR